MINMFDLKPGDRIVLHGGLEAEVVENMDDGMWVQVRKTEDGPGAEAELCHAQDIVRMLPPRPSE